MKSPAAPNLLHRETSRQRADYENQCDRQNGTLTSRHVIGRDPLCQRTADRCQIRGQWGTTTTGDRRCRRDHIGQSADPRGKQKNKSLSGRDRTFGDLLDSGTSAIIKANPLMAAFLGSVRDAGSLPPWILVETGEQRQVREHRAIGPAKVGTRRNDAYVAATVAATE
jgi:hypothetical protein